MTFQSSSSTRTSVFIWWLCINFPAIQLYLKDPKLTCPKVNLSAYHFLPHHRAYIQYIHSGPICLHCFPSQSIYLTIIHLARQVGKQQTCLVSFSLWKFSEAFSLSGPRNRFLQDRVWLLLKLKPTAGSRVRHYWQNGGTVPSPLSSFRRQGSQDEGVRPCNSDLYFPLLSWVDWKGILRCLLFLRGAWEGTKPSVAGLRK